MAYAALLQLCLVLLFHAYARWPQIVPFSGDRFAGFPLCSKYGWLGVRLLFFMISGLRHSDDLGEMRIVFAEFIGRRWLQLFPAMLLLLTTRILYRKPFPRATSWHFQLQRSYFPALPLPSREYGRRVLGSPQGVLEGAFWSLFVEVKFYIIFGALYFLLGRKAALIGLGLIFIISSRLSWRDCQCIKYFLCLQR